MRAKKRIGMYNGFCTYFENELNAFGNGSLAALSGTNGYISVPSPSDFQGRLQGNSKVTGSDELQKVERYGIEAESTEAGIRYQGGEPSELAGIHKWAGAVDKIQTLLLRETGAGVRRDRR